MDNIKIMALINFLITASAFAGSVDPEIAAQVRNKSYVEKAIKSNSFSSCNDSCYEGFVDLKNTVICYDICHEKYETGPTPNLVLNGKDICHLRVKPEIPQMEITKAEPPHPEPCRSNRDLLNLEIVKKLDATHFELRGQNERNGILETKKPRRHSGVMFEEIYMRFVGMRDVRRMDGFTTSAPLYRECKPKSSELYKDPFK